MVLLCGLRSDCCVRKSYTKQGLLAFTRKPWSLPELCYRHACGWPYTCWPRPWPSRADLRSSSSLKAYLMLTTPAAGPGYCHWTWLGPWLAGFTFWLDLTPACLCGHLDPLAACSPGWNWSPPPDLLCSSSLGAVGLHLLGSEATLMPASVSSLAPSSLCLTDLPAPAAASNAFLRGMLTPTSAGTTGTTVTVTPAIPVAPAWARQ